MTNVVPLQSGGRVSGIVPQSIEEVFRLATAVAKSGMAPRGMETAEKLTVAILHGLEIGLPPMQSIQRIAVVNGRPTVWGDALPSLLWARGFKMDETISGSVMLRCATCKITRPDGTTIERQFSAEDAKRAGLWGKTGPWTQYPDRMLQMRARGFAARDGAADALAGLYLKEEIEDGGDITPAKTRTLAIPDIPDIPDEAPEPETSQDGIIREIEKKLEAGVSPALVEREFSSAIMAMDEDGRTTALEMIHATQAVE